MAATVMPRNTSSETSLSLEAILMGGLRPPIRMASNDRLVSLDVFRGITVAAMLLVNNPGSEPAYAQLEHAAWNGWTFTDTIFPFFLWIVGVAMTLSFAKRMELARSDNRH